jgi:hypothetical protein
MIVPIVLLVLVFIIAAAVKSNSKEGGEDMIRKVYVYIVLFATLMMTIGGSVGAFIAIADIIAPTPYHQSFEEYKQNMLNGKFYPDEEVGEKKKLTDEESRERYDAIISSYQDKQFARAKNSLIKSLGWIIIPLPVFIFFQRRLSTKEE